MFLCSDPWVGGGLHQNDVALFAPLFHDGELFGWTVAVAHQLDVGGVSPGSWPPKTSSALELRCLSILSSLVLSLWLVAGSPRAISGS